MLISVCCIDLSVFTCAGCINLAIFAYFILFYFDLDLSPVEITPCKCLILEMVSLL